MLTSIFTLEWYLFNQPNLNIFALSLGDVFLSFLYPIADLLFLLLGVSLFFRPTIFNSKRKIYIFIFVLISSATFNYIYFYLNNHLSTETIILLRLLYRIPILLIAIAGSISEDHNSHKNYFLVNPIIGKSFSCISLSCCCNTNRVYIKRTNIIFNSHYRKLYYFYFRTHSSFYRTYAKQFLNKTFAGI